MFHLLHHPGPLPEVLNNPLCHTEPHPLCLRAAEEVCDYLHHSQLKTEADQGKMMGVLVCRTDDGRVGFLAAYSGQIQGRADWPWFVPAVFDYLQPDGYFKQEEAAISQINQQVKALETSSDYITAQAFLTQLKNEMRIALDSYRQQMAVARERRHCLRAEGAAEEPLIRESQFQKAELRRLTKQWEARVAEAEKPLQAQEEALCLMRQERRRRSDALQQWLFSQFHMLNAKGESRTLTDIFAATPQRVPPSGAGECCAPKLFQYAFSHGLQPLAVAEFWQGRSPRMEVRHHGQFYPACRGKCKPILDWMLKGCCLSQETVNNTTLLPTIVYEDPDLVVIDKPSGLLSVPGNSGEKSVDSILRRRYPQVFIVHRLDQDTSGLMVIALSLAAYHGLQQQFLARTIYKKYIALLDGELHGSGNINLPLRPDPLDRPRQVVDPLHGKAASTDFEVISVENGRSRVFLTPHTGRTHQLRVHCAHKEGLDMPIVGDRLYGCANPNNPSMRLCLHAAELEFRHPITGQQMFFRSKENGRF